MGMSGEDGFWKYGCITMIAIWVCCMSISVYHMCKENIMDRFVADSISKQKHIQDSISNTPAYKDSVRRSQDAYNKRCAIEDSISRSNTLVLTCDDSIYHYSSKCRKVLSYRLDNGFFYAYTKKKLLYSLTTEAEALSRGCHLCEECEDIEKVYEEYEDYELIRRDEIDEYADEIDEDVIDMIYEKNHSF